jgi:hypothetical protein
MNPNKIIEDSIFYRGNPNTWTATPEIKSTIKNLKHTYYEGGYVDKGLLWTLSDNQDIINQFCPKDMKPEVFLNHIAISLQFIVRTFKMENLTQEFIEEKGIQPYHLKLINRLYIDYEECGEDDGPEIHTADKRPFGNSYMIGDVADEMGFEDREDMDGKEEVFMKVYHEVLDLALHIMKESVVPFSSWVHAGDSRGTKKRIPLTPIQEKYLNHDWTIDITEHRDMIIDEIIK